MPQDATFRRDALGPALSAERPRAALQSTLKSAHLTPSRLLWAVTLLAALLRFYHLQTLSLWLDEGYTIQFSRLPWHVVIGLNGAYDPHPPLYYALIKAVTQALPEAVAGRILSAVAGVLTVPVLYTIGSRLLTGWAGLAASCVLALSPLHIWYSQEARQYAPTELCVALSYLSLVAFYKQPGWRWALLYGAGSLTALYLDYSAFYALAPQLIPLAMLFAAQRQRAMPIFISLLASATAYIPWLPQLLQSVEAHGVTRTYLSVTPARIVAASRSLMGFDENRRFFFSSRPTLWETYPDLHSALFYVVLTALLLSVVCIVRRTQFGAAIALSLSAGTVLVGAAVSLASPGFAERTVIYGTLGWALLVGAMVTCRLPLWANIVRIACTAGVALVIVASLVSLYSAGDKQHWHELADATANATAAYPDTLILTYPNEASAILIGVYQPQVLSGKHIALDSPDQLTTPTASSTSRVVFAYLDIGSAGAVRDRLAVLGYRRTSHQVFWENLCLDTWTK